MRSNPELQKLYIDYLMEKYDGQADKSLPLRVEPSDNAGFCTCAGCRALGSISNQVFTLANLAARAVRKKNPAGMVSLNAYYQHGAPPDFDLEPNVMVTVIPNGFQTYCDGDLLMWLWTKKTDLLTYRDYIAIPQWKGDLPQLFAETYLQRVKLARKLHYKGMWMETGSNLPVTIALGLMAQYWANEDSTFDKTLTTLVARAFPHAREPVLRLFNRWYCIWLGPKEEVAAALYDLREAGTLSGNERQRLLDLKAYVHYVRLQHEWSIQPGDSQKAAALEDYIYRSASRLVVHTHALSTVWAKKLFRDTANVSRFRIRFNKDWRWLKPLDEPTIESNFRDDCAAYPPTLVNYTPVPFPDVCRQQAKGRKMLRSVIISWKDRLPIYLYSEVPFTVRRLDTSQRNIRLNGVDWAYDMFYNQTFGGSFTTTIHPGTGGLTRLSVYGEPGAHYELSGAFMLVVPRDYAALQLGKGTDDPLHIDQKAARQEDYANVYYTGMK